MKRIIMAGILLAVLVIGCVCSLHAVTRTTGALADAVGTARAQALAGDLAGSAATLSDGQAVWARHAGWLGTLVRHTELYQIDTLYVRAIQAGESGDRQELLLQTSELLSLLEQVAEMERPTLQNVF